MCRGVRVDPDPAEPAINGSTIVTAKLNFKKSHRLVGENFLRMNRLCEEVGISEDEISRMTFGAVRSAGFPLDENGSLDWKNTLNLPLAMRPANQ